MQRLKIFLRLLCLNAMLVVATSIVSDAKTAPIGVLEEEYFFFEDEDLASIGNFRKAPIPESPGILSVITSRAISRMPARYLTDILKSIPGFDVRYSNFGEYFVSIRGIDKPADILMMINGRRFNDFFTGAAPYDIPVDGIERIEIIRGPGSALYGTNAMVGVINIITKKEEGLNVKVGAGSFNTYKGNIRFGKKFDDLSVYGFLEGYDTAGPDSIIPTDKLRYFDLPGSITPSKVRDDKQKIRGRLDIDYKDIQFGFDMYNDAHGPNVAYLDVMSQKSRYESKYFGSELTKSFALPGGVKLKPSVYMNRWKVDDKIQLFPDGYTDNRDLNGDGAAEYFPDGEWIYKSYESWVYGTDWRFGYDTGKGHDLTAGLSYEESYYKNPSVLTNYSGEPDIGATPMPGFGNWNNYDLSERRRRVSAMFLQDEWKPAKYLNIVAGVRHDRYSDFGNTTNPRVAASIFPLENWDIKLQYATAFRAPTFKELYDDTNLQFRGNPDLAPERVETFEIGVGYKLEKKGFMRLHLFKNVIKNNITTLFAFSRTAGAQYVNAGEQEIRGVEAELKVAASNDVSFYINSTFFNVKDKLSDTWLTRIPQRRLNIGLDVKLPYDSYMSIHWFYSGVSHTNQRIFLERLPQFDQKVGPYNLVNASFAKKNLLNMGITAKFSAFNLFNINYSELPTEVRYRLSELGSNPEKRMVNLIPSNQRSFLFEIQKEF